MFLNRQYFSFPPKRTVERLLDTIEGLESIRKNTPDSLKSHLNSVSISLQEWIDFIIQREGWIVELSQITDNHSGDAKEHRWIVESLEDIHHQRFYKDRVGTIPEVIISVKDIEGQIIFEMSLTEWNSL
jgi:hypothetical protein